MVKSTKAHFIDREEAVLVEERDEEYDDVVARNNSSSSSYRGKSNEQRSTTHRSKHSETEQRRRSKINDRFQLLRNLIPQNDQRKDKASFLLEVIEYVQFLQEKVQMYEGTYQGWSQEPTKLMPRRNHHGQAEIFVGHPRDFKNGSIHENNGGTHSVLTTSQNSVEPCSMGPAGVYKPLDHLSGSTLLSDPISIQTLQDSVSDMENSTYRPESQLWPAKPSLVQCVRNNMVNDQDMATGDESATASSTFSQGVLNTLTEVLQSSGVDLSETNISVQIDVAKQANSGPMSESCSRDTEKQYLNDQVLAHRLVRNYNEDSGQAQKRLRTDKS